MLNTANKKLIHLAKIIGIEPSSISDIDKNVSLDPDTTNWWGIAHQLIGYLELPDENVWLEGLKGQEINSLDEVIACIEWHLDEDNLNHVRNQ